LIINRYLIREISKPLLVVLSVLVVIFSSYSAADYLSDAVNGLLPNYTIAKLIGLRTLIALEVLIPISLYISVVVSLSKLYSESEMTAMFALGVGPRRVMGAVLTLSLALAGGVACLSLLVRPWAYESSHETVNQAEADLNFDEMQAGNFYESPQGSRVIFIGRRDGSQKIMRNVFVKLERHNMVQVIHAREAYQVSGKGDSGPVITFIGAHVYEIGRRDDGNDHILSAKKMILHLKQPHPEPPGYSSVASDSATLGASDAPADVAELQWRVSTPLTTLLLGLLGVPLSRVKPRQGKYAKMGFAILIYSGYYLLCTTARTWVQKGVVGSFPGIWWAPGLLALVLIIALVEPEVFSRIIARRAAPRTAPDRGAKR